MMTSPTVSRKKAPTSGSTPGLCQNPAITPNMQKKFLDFLCREDIGMLNFDYVYYATPNLAVKENLDEETLSDTTIFPTG